MPGVPRARICVLLVLDATHINRQLMLAAPVFSIGLPTLVLLNMSDQLEARGGRSTPFALAKELGHPVAPISASQNKGLFTVIPEFLLREGRVPDTGSRPVQLPVLQSPASCRTWATQVTTRTGYRTPAASLWTQRLDAVLLNRIAGPLIFLAVVFAVFQVVFTLGQPLSDWLGRVLVAAGAHAALLLPDGWPRLLLRDGLWNGVQSVLVFLPQILLLFLFIGILEDSGYLARAALIADRLMRAIGLNGKAFIPLLSAYACAVPAIMATRTIENKRERIATILVAPFMTCSARLPIYTLIIAAFIPNRMFLGGVVGLRALTMLSLYALGFTRRVGHRQTAQSSGVMKASAAPFILELPQYRWPTVCAHSPLRLYDRGKLFVKKVGTIVLGVTLMVWVFSVLPVHAGAASDLTTSIVGRIGHFIEPVIRPLGFNWKVGIGLVCSIVAREAMPATLGHVIRRASTTKPNRSPCRPRCATPRRSAAPPPWSSSSPSPSSARPRSPSSAVRPTRGSTPPSSSPT